MIEFSCKNCGSRLNVANEHSGRRVRCPTCRRVNVVPGKRDKMDFYCGHCGRRIRVPRIQVGKKGKCPKCKKVIVVPSLERKPAGVTDTVSVVCSICDKVVNVRRTSTGRIIECPACGSYIDTSCDTPKPRADSAVDDEMHEESPEESKKPVRVNRRIIACISALVALLAAIIILAVIVVQSVGVGPIGALVGMSSPVLLLVVLVFVLKSNGPNTGVLAEPRYVYLAMVAAGTLSNLPVYGVAVCCRDDPLIEAAIGASIGPAAALGGLLVGWLPFGLLGFSPNASSLGDHLAWLVVLLVGSLAYFGLMFLPLLGVLYDRARTTCIVLQLLFAILHSGLPLILFILLVLAIASGHT